MNNNTNKSRIIIHKKVHDPERFGVYDKNKNIIIEKPKHFISNYAVTGIYKYKYDDLSYLSDLKNQKEVNLK